MTGERASTPAVSGAPHDVVVVDVRMDHPLAQPLVQAELEELAELYGGDGDASPLEVSELLPPRGAFFVALVGDTPVGCGGMRKLLPGKSAGFSPAAEIKRMFTAKEARGQGVAESVLEVIAARAQAMGVHYLLLETGVKQMPAVRLYQRFGFSRIEGFGYYQGYDEQVAMMLDVRPRTIAR